MDVLAFYADARNYEYENFVRTEKRSLGWLRFSLAQFYMNITQLLLRYW